jgi:hypothetical protein
MEEVQRIRFRMDIITTAALTVILIALIAALLLLGWLLMPISISEVQHIKQDSGISR